MKYLARLSMTMVLISALTLSLPMTIAASPKNDEAAVLQQEARWLKSIVDGDKKAIESILGTNYKHINSKGKLIDRTKELAGTVKESFTMNPSEQTVDFAGDTAVVHGLNTIKQGDKVLARERFTDVFVKQNGVWMALSAQETAI